MASYNEYIAEDLAQYGMFWEAVEAKQVIGALCKLAKRTGNETASDICCEQDDRACEIIDELAAETGYSREQVASAIEYEANAI